MYFSANMQRQAISDAMTKGLYEKTRDAQEGVLLRWAGTQHWIRVPNVALLWMLTEHAKRAAQWAAARQADRHASVGRP